MMKYVLAAIVWLMLLAASSGQVNGGLPAVDNPAQAKAPEIVLPEMKLEGGISESFAEVMRAAGMSGGIAKVNEMCSPDTKMTVVVTAGTTLSHALDEITLANTNSQWRLNDNVVNMFPASSMPPLLQVPIHRFQWNKAESVKEIIARLRGSEEVSRKARELGLKSGSYGGWQTGICVRDCPKPKEEEPQIEKDATLLDVLNHVFRAHPGAVWAYHEQFCQGERTFNLDTLAE